METRGPFRALVERVIPRLKHPHLFLILLALFLIDMFFPDPLPFVDELVLALLTFLAGSWRKRRELPAAAEPPGSSQGKGPEGPYT
ncbi:MAG: hypothetical protein JXO72_05615 [Vicinamibacteria bacterium]|nr:hypothetical protein [Vicinamibacteria bacterium]